jgi:hypothetical protein
MENKKWKMTRHHRVPRSMGGTNDKRNISLVPENKHVAYHTLFGAGDVEVIVNYLNRVWINPDIELVIRKREHKVHNKHQLKIPFP